MFPVDMHLVSPVPRQHRSLSAQRAPLGRHFVVVVWLLLRPGLALKSESGGLQGHRRPRASWMGLQSSLKKCHSQLRCVSWRTQPCLPVNRASTGGATGHTISFPLLPRVPSAPPPGKQTLSQLLAPVTCSSAPRSLPLMDPPSSLQCLLRLSPVDGPEHLCSTPRRPLDWDWDWDYGTASLPAAGPRVCPVTLVLGIP